MLSDVAACDDDARPGTVWSDLDAGREDPEDIDSGEEDQWTWFQ